MQKKGIHAKASLRLHAKAQGYKYFTPGRQEFAKAPRRLHAKPRIRKGANEDTQLPLREITFLFLRLCLGVKF